MTEQGQPSPQRIGDAERDSAAELLREHMAQGRLTAEEFDERIDAALRAKVASDLDPLFSDLPGPRPGQTLATTQPHATPDGRGAAARTPVPAQPLAAPAASTRNPALAIVTAVMWPATILLISALGWGDFWWLIFVPVMISSFFGKEQHDRRDRERERIRREQRRLDERRRAIGD